MTLMDAPRSPISGALEVTIVAKDVGPVGGMELQLTELVTGLLGRGHRVTLIAQTCDLPNHPGLRWVRVPGPARPFTLAYPWFLVVATFLIRLRGRGVIHATGAMALGRADLSTVHYCHAAASGLKGFARVSKSGRLYRLNAWASNLLSVWGERWCYNRRRVEVLVGVSGGVERELREYFPRMRDRIEMIPNGVDTVRFSPPPSDGDRADAEPVTALFVGGDWERKGLRQAIEAVAMVPGTSLLVVGLGDIAGYRELAGSLGVAERVEFAGQSADTAPWYRRADVFLLPTAYETFSLVTYEAAASGLPLLVTPVSGVEDLLKDGQNGWFIDREPEAIADRLRRLVDDPELRRRFGRRAREDSLRFSWDRVVEDYCGLYARLS